MESHLGGLDWGVIGILLTIAGYLAKKVVDHEAKLASLTTHKDDVKERFDRQDKILQDLDNKLDAIMLRFNVRPSPFPPGE